MAKLSLIYRRVQGRCVRAPLDAAMNRWVLSVDDKAIMDTHITHLYDAWGAFGTLGDKVTRDLWLIGADLHLTELNQLEASGLLFSFRQKVVAKMPQNFDMRLSFGLWVQHQERQWAAERVAMQKRQQLDKRQWRDRNHSQSPS